MERVNASKCTISRMESIGDIVLKPHDRCLCKQCFVRLIGYRSDLLFLFAFKHNTAYHRVLMRRDVMEQMFDALKSAAMLKTVNGEFTELLRNICLSRKAVRWLMEIGDGLFYRELPVYAQQSVLLHIIQNKEHYFITF